MPSSPPERVAVKVLVPFLNMLIIIIISSSSSISLPLLPTPVSRFSVEVLIPFDHTERHTTVGRTPLDEGSARPEFAIARYKLLNLSKRNNELGIT
jgi:hypothetical protein